MANTENPLIALPSFLQRAIEHEIENITDEELEKAKKRIEERKAEAITAVILHVQKVIEIERIGEKLLISIRLEERNN